MMGAPLPICGDMPAQLRRLARRETDGRVMCRPLGLANVLDGMTRADTAGMDRQTLRDWVIRFNAEGDRGSARSAQERPPELARRRSAGGLQSIRAARPGPGPRWREQLAGQRSLARLASPHFSQGVGASGL